MPIPQLKIRSPRSWKQHQQKPSRRPSKKKVPKYKPSKRTRKSSARTYKVKVRGSSKSLLSFLKSIKFKIIKCVLIILIVFLIVLASTFAYYAKDLPNPNKIISRSIAQSTKIYDRTGETLLYEISGEQKRTLIELESVPDYAIWATISIEDKNFYKHGGISLWGIVRGQIMPRLQGKRAQGGSTLTQQLVKNAILTNERKISRKIKEWILSYRIEQKFSKDEILKLYFNEIPYGSNAYGIEAAANYYFGKLATDLNLAESAILAALPQAPSYYSPYGSNKNILIDRQRYILGLMVEQDYITTEQATEAKEYELEFKNRITNIIAPHFVLYVKEYLANKYGEQMIEQGGLRVITTLDVDAQTIAEQAVEARTENNLDQYNASNAALIAIDVQLGQIIAMVGSKDYFDDDIDGQVNVTIQPRQPGSSFKPFVYLTGFTQGYTPETILFDLNTVFRAEPKDYEPKNYDLEEHGPVSIRKALAGSLNVPATKMIYLTGVSNVLDLADLVGYSTFGDRSRFGLSLVLGGGEVKLIEHVNAYAALAREGIWIPYHSILRVENSGGQILEEYHKPKGERVVAVNYIRMLTDIMTDNEARAYVFGETNYLTLPGRPVASKTGTTDDYRDAWTIGFTPYQVAAGVWVGNNNNAEMKKGAAGGVLAAPIWQTFMKNYLSNKEIKPFAPPNYTNSTKPMVGGFMEGGDIIKIDKFSGKLASEHTPEQAIVEKKFLEIHNILHYVQRGDPLGPAPQNPEEGYQYNNWERSVQKWVQEQGFASENPPTEYDDLHRPEDKPSITLTSPINNSEITGWQLNIVVSASAPRGARQVKFFLDNKEIGTSSLQPFSYIYTLPPSLTNGSYALTAKVYDDILNNNEHTIIIKLSREEYIKMSWITPNAGTTLSASDFPYKLEIGVEDLSLIKQVDFYYRLSESNQSKWFGVVKTTNSQPFFLVWQSNPGTGIYKVYPVFTDRQNQVVQGRAITISIEE